MSVEELRKIDFTGFDPKTGAVLLVVSDHLDWDEHEGEHLLILQDKLNAYLGVIETGQLYTEYPKAIGRKIVIKVMGKYPLSEEANKFYRLAGKYIEDAGFSLQFEHLKDD
jgi:hypothetical protein